MIKIKCPCCGYFTQKVEYEGEPLFEICGVCFWQYDTSAHKHPDISIGANHISLSKAKENFAMFGVCKPEHKNMVRAPLEDELA